MKFFIIILVICFLSCTDNPDYNNYYDYIKLEQGKGKWPDHLMVVTIPSTGCNSCISPVLRFLKAHINELDYQFIITEITDKKLLQEWLGNELFNNPRLIIDTDNAWRRFNLSAPFPLIIILKRGEIVRVKYMNNLSKSTWDQL
ncbi:MAG TPA: hypothetical protein PK185_07745 [Cyclobacteriaceae bacterium]|nr:hypothetical protein [Cyclobacteriaceae bacterium]